MILSIDVLLAFESSGPAHLATGGSFGVTVDSRDGHPYA
jgi:hypothetical protein